MADTSSQEGCGTFSDRLVTTHHANFFPNVVAPEQTSDSEKTTGRVVLAFKPQSDSMFYASAATGFRAGINQSPAVVISNPEFPGVDPDSTLTYELGAKGRVLANSLTYETALYFMDWQDIQQELIVPHGFRAKLNAGSASGYGVDLGLGYEPTDDLALHLNVGWNDLAFDKDVFTGPAILFRKGARPNASSEWTGSLGASYGFATPLPNVRTVMSTNFTYNSTRLQRFLTAGVLRETASDPVRNLVATVGLETERWSLDLYGENLLDDESGLNGEDITAGNMALRYRPRTLGVQFTINY